MSFVRWACIVIAWLMGSCSSTSPHFYTLVPESGRPPAAAAAAGYRVEIQPVRVPAQIDRLELVTRLAGGGMAVADGDRWIAPVADELQNALTIELLRRLGGTGRSDAASLSVRVDVERFESAPRQYALIEASWRLELKQTGTDVRIVCRTRAYEQVSGGYPEMVRGYQRAITRIADQIATVAQESAGGVARECPVS
jgi:uncharacterized lipoprotein YmbA